ncbi:MAG TPA: ABC transporter permease [Acidimicrobiales bacterium]|nr:ABC transporter permease [Acidimicrobiales bacterium]
MTNLDTATPRATPPAAFEPGLSRHHSLRRTLRLLTRDRTSMLGLVIVTVLIVLAVIGPWVAPHDPNRIPAGAQAFASPSARFPLGTDYLGRDTLSRLLYGARLSIFTTIYATVLITVVGTILGLLAGFFGGVVDGAIVWLIDILLAFPSLLLALALTAVLGPGLRHITLALVLVWWTGYARLVRAAVLAQRSAGYVEAAASLGASRARLLWRHVLPNVITPVAVYATLELGAILLAISALSFLGLGVNPPTPEWGSMLSSAKPYLDAAPQLLIYPGAAIFLFALGFNLLGDGLRDLLDPRTGT